MNFLRRFDGGENGASVPLVETGASVPHIKGKLVMRKLIRSVLATAKNHKSKIAVAAVTVVAAGSAMAGTDATAITTAASSAFTDIATLCVSIGTFFVVYRLVRRVG